MNTWTRHSPEFRERAVRLVADSTYVATLAGFVYVAFMFDAFARRIIGSRVVRSMHAESALDALVETIIGLYETENIHHRGPRQHRQHLEAVEYATLECVNWFNHRRQLEPIGNVPPAAVELA